ncbi:MAG: TIGR03905 family TSCPD domain-containing protein [Treponema sp.]|nr:TIGR03905 family TSCPD domain-containing protein [Treponema sp.]
MASYKLEGTCAQEVSFDLREGKVHDIAFTRGCKGNLSALGILAEGMDARELSEKLGGLQCGEKGTSCGDQLSLALRRALNQALADAQAGTAA